MKISLNWLREYVDYDGTPEALSDLLTMAGVEVEGIETRGANFDQVVVAQILSREQHPNADRLGVCRVDDGSGTQPPRQIVCGATNYKVGDKVPLALPGSVLPGDFKIKASKLRGVESEGMLCSAKELGLAEDAQGLLILSPDAPVGAPIGSLFPSDTILDLEITPNRSDLLSHTGLAREVAALSGKTFHDPVDEIETPVGGDPVAHLPVMVAANARDRCPAYTARVIDGVKVGPSPGWLRSRLESVGVRAINNVVDITNFVMLELGQPLHAFDAQHVGPGGIGVRLASAGEELLALDGKKYQLKPDHLVIAQVDGGKAEALAGIMGGEESGVTTRTTRLILESAYFAPAGIRHTSRELGLSSDASYRFERGVDPTGVLAASRRAEDLILEICGGTSLGLAQAHILAGGVADDTAPDVVTLRLARCQQVLGTDISQARVNEILTGFGLEEDDESEIDEESRWLIPAHRQDLRREIDLIEEIARVHGLNDVPSRVRAWFSPASPVDREYDFNLKIRRALVGLGFMEARNVTLVRMTPGWDGIALVNPLTEDELTGKSPVSDQKKREKLILKNALTEDGTVLRETLLHGLKSVAGRNMRQGSVDLRLFEIGRVFLKDFPDEQPEESLKLGLLMAGAATPSAWRHGSGKRAGDVHDLRGVIETLAGAGTPVELQRRKWAEGPEYVLVAEVMIAGKSAGMLAQLAPSRAKELELRGDVLVAELKLSVLQALAGSGPAFTPLARFPSVTRDLAVVADRSLAHGEIAAKLRGAGEGLLTRVELFDVFTDDKGEKIAPDKKSLAYSLTYRAEDRTLKTEEVNAAHARLKSALQAGFAGLQFRE